MADLMQIRRLILAQGHTRYIGGLPVLVNNARFGSGNGTISDVQTDSDYFITGFFDSGDSASKSYTYTNNPYDSAKPTYMRLYNDIAAKSYDYWSCAHASDPTRNIKSGGRFIAFSVLKSLATGMYMYDNTNGVYVFKGLNVH